MTLSNIDLRNGLISKLSMAYSNLHTCYIDFSGLNSLWLKSYSMKMQLNRKITLNKSNMQEHYLLNNNRLVKRRIKYLFTDV
jgi:hypothetical protein